MELSDKQVATAAQAAILNAISGEDRDVLITEAIGDIFKVRKSENYPYDEISVMRDVFRSVVSGLAREEVRKVMEKDEAIRGRITDVVTASLEKALEDGELVDSIARLIGDSFSKAAEKAGW